MANISNAIAGIPHLKAFDDVFKNRFDNIDLSAVLMYIVDNSPVNSLFYLAEQFNVLGHRGWILADTEAKKRNLIKSAIELNRYKGTIYAIETAVKSVGFTFVEVIEHVGVDYDGQYNNDGTITAAGGNWATFRVQIGLDNNYPINVLSIDNLRKFIEEYKNTRSHLLNIVFQIAFSDVIGEPNEFLDLGEGSQDFIFSGNYYDGAVLADGSSLSNKGVEVCSLTITNSQTGQIITDEF